jgi:predicted TPR repeat methyltransferase
MAEKDEAEALERVYAAKTPEELAAAYAQWAADYDRETAEKGYCLPFLITSWVARHVPKGSGPILDVGVGTGLSGPYMKALGYEALAGFDLSDDMLAIARGRGTYGELVQAELGKALPWADGHFAAVFSTGVFTAGHAPASGLDELARITRPGGHAIFTVRDVIIESGGFAERMAALEKAGTWRPIEESEPFRAFAIDEPEVLVKTFVFEITR